MMRQKKVFFLVIVFAFFALYITNVLTIPDNIVLMQNEKFKFGFLDKFFVKTTDVGQSIIKFSALGVIPVKEVAINVLPETRVIPSGELVGIRVFSKGVLVVGVDKVEGIDGNEYDTDTNLKKGDVITALNGIIVERITELRNIVEMSNGEKIIVTFLRDDKSYETVITPIKSFDDNRYKLGVWVRDGVTGIGTMTFYNPSTNNFVALGHGISDSDTEEIIKLEKGEICDADVISINRSVKSKPGEIRGRISSFSRKGIILDNTNFGLYGKLDVLDHKNNEVLVASRNEIKVGKASIFCSIDGEIVKEYDIEIQKVYLTTGDTTKSMIIKIVDEELLQTAGGIVQGMSGSPILQNGKLVGAVTHVFVNDPKRGYGIFADTLLANE